MAITNRITISCTDGSAANAITGTITNTPGLEVVINESLGIGTDVLVNGAVDVSTMTNVILLSTGSDATVKTNSSGAPDATISLVDGVPLFWNYQGGYPASGPFGSTDVTKFYVTNAAATVLQILIGADATP